MWLKRKTKIVMTDTSFCLVFQQENKKEEPQHKAWGCREKDNEEIQVERNSARRKINSKIRT